MITHLLQHTCDIYRQAQGFSTGTLQPKNSATRSAIALGLRCRINALSARARYSLMGIFPSVSHRMFWENTVLKCNDQVTWDNKTYVLVEVTAPMGLSGNVHHYEGLLEEKKV